MSTITHTHTANIPGRVRYLVTSNRERTASILHSSTGAETAPELTEEITENQQAWSAVRRPTLHEIMVSFPADESIPANHDRIRAAVKDLAAELAGNRDFFIVEHTRTTDGRREFHIAITPPDRETGRLFRCGRGEIRRDGRGSWQKTNDEICRRHGLGVVERTARENLTHAEAQQLARRGSMPATIARRRQVRDLVRESLPLAGSVDDFLNRCSQTAKQRGDTLHIRQGKAVLSFKLESWGQDARPVRLNKIEKAWTVDGLAALIAIEHGKQPARGGEKLSAAIAAAAGRKPTTQADAAAQAEQIAADYDLDIFSATILQAKIYQQIARRCEMDSTCYTVRTAAGMKQIERTPAGRIAALQARHKTKIFADRIREAMTRPLEIQTKTRPTRAREF